MLRPHRNLVCSVFAVLMMAGSAPAQQAQSTGARYYYNPLEQSLQWLRDKQVQKEIKLAPEQEKKLVEIRREFSAKTQQIYKDLRTIDGDDRYETLYARRKQLSQEIEGKVRKVLQKPQVERLRQIMLQMSLLRQGSSRTLLLDEIAADLNITEKQKAELQKVDKQARQEMQEKLQRFYKEIQDEALQKVLQVLRDEQQTKLKTMTGKEFELRRQLWRPAVTTGTKGGS